MQKLSQLVEYISSRYWAMDHTILARFCRLIEDHTADKRNIAAAESFREKNQKKEKLYHVTDDGAAVIPVSGVIAKYARMVNGSSQPQGTSVERLKQQLDEAIADRSVESVLLLIESPGGSINGVADFARQVYDASFVKPVTAYIDDLGASAAYWIASQANEIYANVTASIGSIGVYALLTDSSEYARRQGLKFHILRSGQHKGVGAPGIEITNKNIQTLQQQIEVIFEIFLGDIIRGRQGKGLYLEKLRELADGRSYIAADALKEKLIDGISTLPLAIEKPQIRTNNVFSKKEFTMNKLVSTPNQPPQRPALIDDDLSTTYRRAVLQELRSGESKAGAYAEAARKFPRAHRAWLSDGAKPVLESGDDGRPETFQAAVDSSLAQGDKRSEAFAQAARNFPKAHKAWLDSQQR